MLFALLTSRISAWLGFLQHGILKRYRELAPGLNPGHRGVMVRDINDFRANNNSSNRKSGWKNYFL